VDAGFLCDKAAVLWNIVKWLFPIYREENFTKINLKYVGRVEVCRKVGVSGTLE
jgi:hypothetical protein